MKKLLLVLLLLILVFTGCTPKAPVEGGNKEFDKVTVFFVPSRDPQQITVQTEPLKQLIIDEMATHGYTIKEVDIQVSPNYEAAGEALEAGQAHIAFIPASTYALYSGPNIDVILAASRDGLNKDSVNAKDWNDGEPTLPVEEQVTFYRSLIYAGPSEKGRELAAKVNAGEDLTWEDLNSANWCRANTTSSAGFIYPSLWLAERYDGKMVSDVANTVEGSYAETANRLAIGQCDVGVGYADIRRDYAGQWKDDWGKTDIWTETDVIGVTDPIMNDTISVSNKLVDADMKKALQETFIAIAKTQAGLDAIEIYNHTGYKEVTDADYEPSRKILELLKD